MLSFMSIKDYEVKQLADFFAQADADGKTNAEKIGGFSADDVKNASGIIYDEKWKETGEWQQKFVASPKEGFEFKAWVDDITGDVVSEDSTMDVEIGTAARMTATFIEK
ncbi:MAG: hypothetical protein Q4F70_04895 [Clostridia bacterium]|nr:hypothetical protein [Clostridia bacterium]